MAKRLNYAGLDMTTNIRIRDHNVGVNSLDCINLWVNHFGCSVLEL
jgi:hypothetical protein